MQQEQEQAGTRNVAAKLLPWKGGGGTQNAMTKTLKHKRTDFVNSELIEMETQLKRESLSIALHV